VNLEVLRFAVGRVLIVVSVIPPVPTPISVFVVVCGSAVLRPDVGQREDGFAASFVRGRPQQRDSVGVGALEPAPAQRARCVLVVEQVDETVRRVGRGPR